MHHRLLVAPQHISQRRLGAGLCRLDLGLQQRLTHAGHVAVTEDAEAPAKNLLRSPSRSTYWFARNRTVAWATVSRTVGSLCGDLNADALETTSHSS